MTYPTQLTQPTLDEVGQERERQHEKWGPQHHPDGTGSLADVVKAKKFKRVNDTNAEFPGATNWHDILAEEVYEAFAEAEAAELRAELVQVAAVAVAWVEDIDSRG